MNRSPRRLLPLNPLRAFEAAARHLSFTQAAEELGVTQGAVSRHIRALEDRLGFPLFVRTAQGLRLDQGGRVYAQVLHDAFTRIARATDNLIATQTHLVLTIRGYTIFFIRWLIPRLPAFQRIHANIEVRLVAATDPVDFDRDAVDIGSRYGRDHWRGWRSDLLFMDELSPVCDPGYLAQRDASSPATLITASTLLHHNRRPSDWTEWLAAAGIAQVLHANLYFEDLSIVYTNVPAPTSASPSVNDPTSKTISPRGGWSSPSTPYFVAISATTSSARRTGPTHRRSSYSANGCYRASVRTGPRSNPRAPRNRFRPSAADTGPRPGAAFSKCPPKRSSGMRNSHARQQERSFVEPAPRGRHCVSEQRADARFRLRCLCRSSNPALE
jgi:LysR family glycine cleavage system transcriptional activator